MATQALTDFVAGGSAVVGHRLLPKLIAAGHQVVATTTTPVRLPRR